MTTDSVSPDKLVSVIGYDVKLPLTLCPDTLLSMIKVTTNSVSPDKLLSVIGYDVTSYVPRPPSQIGWR